ncbi:MFS transporter [Brevibacillus sp. SYSU BS000544]|uniref:MFS transporter n=1 Tax=Brevibacillus sp. SYSU BS000544 TaxID=3416443 RepID=UPI003CE58C99
MKFRDFHPNIKIRIVVQFFTNLATMMVVPYLAIYFASRVGETITGIMFLTVICSGVAGGFVGGFYGDRLGRKKLLVISECFVGITYLLIALSNSSWFESIPVTFILFIINMFFVGVFAPASQAMVIDVSASEERKYVFGFMYWSFNLSLALGGLIGAYLFETYRFALFLSVAIISLFSMLTTIIFISETHQRNEKATPATGRETNFVGTYKQVLRDKVFLLFVFAGILISSVENQLTNYIGIRLAKELPAQAFLPFQVFPLEVDGMRMLGILRTENTLLVVLFTTIVTAIMKRYHDRNVLTWGIFFFTLGFMVLGFSNQPWVLLLAMLVLSIGELMYIPIKQAILGDIPPTHLRSSYMAINGMTQYIAMMVGAVGITLGSFLSSWTMSLLFAVMGFGGLLLLRSVLREVAGRRKLNKEQEISA